MSVTINFKYHKLIITELSSGHGPFSHLFDSMFIPRACPGSSWKVSLENYADNLYVLLLNGGYIILA